MSYIDSRTSGSPLLLLLLLSHAPVLGYYFASNIVLEEFVMQVSFGLATVLQKKKTVILQSQFSLLFPTYLFKNTILFYQICLMNEL